MFRYNDVVLIKTGFYRDYTGIVISCAKRNLFTNKRTYKVRLSLDSSVVSEPEENLQLY